MKSGGEQRRTGERGVDGYRRRFAAGGCRPEDADDGGRCSLEYGTGLEQEDEVGRAAQIGEDGGARRCKGRRRLDAQGAAACACWRFGEGKPYSAAVASINELTRTLFPFAL
jgi:hypothetical protein